jgi:hypothetical protein
MQQEVLLTALLSTGMALCAGATLVLSYLHWKAQKPRQGDHLKKAKLLDGLLRDHPIEREFKKVFMTTSKEGKQALIKRWTDRKNCDREEAMRLAIEELR